MLIFMGKEVQVCNLGGLELYHSFGQVNIQLFGSNGQQYCYKKSGEHFLNQHVQPIVKYWRRSIMVWRCMS
jgi:hypothetical protein